MIERNFLSVKNDMLNKNLYIGGLRLARTGESGTCSRSALACDITVDNESSELRNQRDQATEVGLRRVISNREIDASIGSESYS